MKKFKKFLGELAVVTIVVAPLAWGANWVYKRFFDAVHGKMLDQSAGVEYQDSGRTCVDLLDECHNVNAEQWPMQQAWFKEVRQMEKHLDRCESRLEKQAQRIKVCEEYVTAVEVPLGG
jgi:hypothetical protein